MRLCDFSFHLSSTFIYELILIKMYMNAIIMNTQIFYQNKYDLKGQWRSQKFTLHLVLSSPLFLLLSLYISLSISLFCHMQKLIYIQQNVFYDIKYDLKGHMRPLLYRMIFKNFWFFNQITTLTYILMDNFCSISRCYNLTDM